MIFVLAGTFLLRHITLAIEMNASFYFDAPVTTINVFFEFGDPGTKIGGVLPVWRMVHATMTLFVNRSAIVNTTTTSFVNHGVIV